MLLGGCALPSVREAARPHSPKPPSHPQMGSCPSSLFCSQLRGRLWQGVGTTILAPMMESCLPCSVPHPPCGFTCLLEEGLLMSQLSWESAWLMQEIKACLPMCAKAMQGCCVHPPPRHSAEQQPAAVALSLLASSNFTSSSAGNFPSQ